MYIFKELWLFMRVRKKYWLLPIFIMMALFGGLIVLTQGSAVAPFIYTISSLGPSGPIGVTMRILGISAFYHDSAAALVEDGQIVAGRPGGRFSGEKATPASRAPQRLLPGGRGCRARRGRLRRVLRQTVSQVRAADGNLSRVRAARVPQLPPWRCHCGSRKSCSRSPCCATSCAVTRRTSTGRTGCCSPNPSEPRGERFLSLAL